MAQYEHRRFFRKAPKFLLARYFHDFRNVLLEFDFANVKPGHAELLFQAFIQLDADVQSSVESDFQVIEAMVCEGGVSALIDEATFHQDTDFAEKIAEIDGFHGKMLWAFLEHPNYWRNGNLFQHADQIAESYWKRRRDIPKVNPDVGPEAIHRFERVLSEFFHSQQGRGRQCKVDVLRRDHKEYFFAYPEDHAQANLEWVHQTLDTRARHPAFEIIFVYDQAGGALDIYAPRNSKIVPQLQWLFADTILGLDELDPLDTDRRIFVLNGLDDRLFNFRYAPESGIERVAVRMLRLSLVKTNPNQSGRVTIEVDASSDPGAIYRLLDELQLPPYRITQAEIQVTFAPEPGRASPMRKFKLSYPNWCALRHTGHDAIIRQMLVDSGIDPV